MTSVAHMAITSTRFYTLAEAHKLAGIAPDDMLRLAGAALLNLCVLVPAGKRAYTVDPSSVVTWDHTEHLNRDVFHTKPDRERGIPVRTDDVLAVVLDPVQCHQVFDHGVSRQVFFLSAYAIEGGRSSGIPMPPVHMRAVRFPLFSSDGRMQADQSRWRFAIYPHSTQFQFVDGIGYLEPEDILVTTDALFVLGFELRRLPRAIDLSPIDDDVGDEEITKQEHVIDVDEVKSTIAEAVVDTSAELHSRQDALGSAAVDETVAPSIDKVQADVRPGLIPDAREPVTLLTREEVEILIKKGKSWIYERTNKKHPNFDPTFPQSIKIGSNVGWIKSEVDEWWQLQIQNGIEEARGTRAK